MHELILEESATEHWATLRLKPQPPPPSFVPCRNLNFSPPTHPHPLQASLSSYTLFHSDTVPLISFIIPIRPSILSHFLGQCEKTSNQKTPHHSAGWTTKAKATQSPTTFALLATKLDSKLLSGVWRIRNRVQHIDYPSENIWSVCEEAR